MRYYSSFGPNHGTLHHRDVPGALGVHGAPDGGGMPVGIAFGLGPDDQGFARFRLVVRNRDVDGEFRLVDREFIRIDEESRQP